MKTKTQPQPQYVLSIGRQTIPVRDADALRTVHVTEADIQGANPRDHQNCAFARAIKRVLGAEWVDVSSNRVLIKEGNRLIKRYALAPVAKEQVKYFDTHEGAMAPCVLALKPPSSSVRLGAKAGHTVKPRERAQPVQRKRPTR